MESTLQNKSNDSSRHSSLEDYSKLDSKYEPKVINSLHQPNVYEKKLRTLKELCNNAAFDIAVAYMNDFLSYFSKEHAALQLDKFDYQQLGTSFVNARMI
eukprot:TRINITY_DN10713_c0_g1_i1.p1 TRINITY_DN10713_c0_g1~~TRINITY_DN10713_c0_g1_i1.p1  ORF type:complete len:100 (+),score=14.49 TRINITY_DN10713_c0_g1_i1:148-447(+)